MRAVAVGLAVATLLLAGCGGGEGSSATDALIAFESNRDGDPWPEVSVMHADGAYVRTLTGPGVYATEPAWSPDGRELAYARSRENAEPFAIYLMNADGSGRRRLTAPAASESDFPPGRPTGAALPSRAIVTATSRSTSWT